MSLFNENLYNACQSFSRKTNGPNNRKSNFKKNWYDNDCKKKQQEFYESLDNFRRDKSDTNRTQMTRNRNEYKTMNRKKKYEFDTKQTRKLEALRYKNAKEYWKLLKI